jgi:uncharacterized membrane protein YkvA (DUF1232 family)
MGESSRRFLSFWRQKARELKVQTLALYFAYRDPRVAWYAKVWIALVVAYAFSPIDLIPDFIPVLGYLDDMVIVPLGVFLALKMVPAQVMEESREKASAVLKANRPEFRFMTGVIIGIWVLTVLLVGWLGYQAFRK